MQTETPSPGAVRFVYTCATCAETYVIDVQCLDVAPVLAARWSDCHVAGCTGRTIRTPIEVALFVPA